MVVPQNGANTQDQLIQMIASWMFANYHKIQEARKSNGGWEIWAQVELKFRLDPPVGPNPPYQVTRELANIWQNINNNNAHQQIIDFWLQSANPQLNRSTGIELKCRNLEASINFRDRFRTDCLKVEQQLQQQRGPADMYAMAMTHDITDTNNNINGINNIFFFPIPAPFGWNTGQIYLMWHPV